MSLSQAYARLQAGDPAGAEALLTSLIASDARNTEALHMRAVARHQRGDLNGALADLDTMLEYPPDHADTRFNRGNILFQLKRYEDALRDYERATVLAPEDRAIWLNRAAAERALGRDEHAAESYAVVLRLDPRNAAALSDRAASLGRLGRFKDALEDIELAVTAAPNDAAVCANRGKLLMEVEHYLAAVGSFELALRLNAASGAIWNNYATALGALGRDEEAFKAFDRAASAPVRDFDAGHPLYNKGLMYLARGNYAEGFALYARRVDLGVVARPPSAGAIPEWNGAPLDGVLRIWSEQGVGDQLLFTRLLPLVLARAPSVVLDCDARLAPLLRRSHPSLTIVAPNAPFDGAAAQIAMGDLARVLGVTPNEIAQLPPVLRADETKVAAIRARYETLAQGKPIVGLAWASPRAKQARLKGAGLEHWAPLLTQPYFFVSLQYGAADAQPPIYVDASIRCGLLTISRRRLRRLMRWSVCRTPPCMSGVRWVSRCSCWRRRRAGCTGIGASRATRRRGIRA
jgi:tetratricopeptide (TPR) repeat protein